MVKIERIGDFSFETTGNKVSGLHKHFYESSSKEQGKSIKNLINLYEGNEINKVDKEYDDDLLSMTEYLAKVIT